MIVRRLLPILGLLLLVLASCGGDSPWVQDNHQRALALWSAHERAVARATSGITVGEEFGEACSFFTDVTGIEIRGDGSYVGWIPTVDTKEDLRKIRVWYHKNSEKLYWDPKSQTVRVCEARRLGAGGLCFSSDNEDR